MPQKELELSEFQESLLTYNNEKQFGTGDEALRLVAFLKRKYQDNGKFPRVYRYEPLLNYSKKPDQTILQLLKQAQDNLDWFINQHAGTQFKISLIRSPIINQSITFFITQTPCAP